MRNKKTIRSLLSPKHFNEPNHSFQQHTEFALIEQIRKQTTDEETRKLMKKRENFWILKLKTSQPDGLNQELNDID